MRKTIYYLLSLSILLLSACGNENTETIKVISYNIRLSGADDGTNSWEHRKSATLSMINSEQPDLLGIQEGVIDQVRYIEDNSPQYARLGVGRDDGVEQGEIMAIFYLTSRLELLSHGTFWLSETPDSVSRGWDAAYNRTATWGLFRDMRSGGDIYFLNTHLDNMGELAREESIKLISNNIEQIQTEGVAIVVCGDFNCPADDAIFSPFGKLITSTRDTSPTTDNKMTYTGFGNDTPMQLDHMFHQGVIPQSFRTLDADYGAPYISDHYPIEAIFEIHPPQATL